MKDFSEENIRGINHPGKRVIFLFWRMEVTIEWNDDRVKLSRIVQIRISQITKKLETRTWIRISLVIYVIKYIYSGVEKILAFILFIRNQSDHF